MKPIVAIIGKPNVGKSSLFNRLTGRRIAITLEVPGTTRDRLYGDCLWGKYEFILVDTAGIALGEKDELATDIFNQIKIVLGEADLIIFLTDITTGITQKDEQAAEILRKTKKPVILTVNKIDGKFKSASYQDFYKLGLGDPLPISSLHGTGTGDLLDKVVKYIKPSKKSQKAKEEKLTKVAIVGRPNVGKTSILNALLKDKRGAVSEMPGTTRDTITGEVQIEKERIILIDMAGIRKRGKIEPGIEAFSALRAIKAITESLISLIVIDAKEGATAQDTHLAGFAKEEGKGIILVVNKWDLVKNEPRAMDKYTRHLKERFDFIYFAPIIFVSAQTRENIPEILKLILNVKESLCKRIQTSDLNQYLGEVIRKKPPKSKKNIRIYYSTQASINPPTFIIFTNFPEEIHFSYLRYLENKIREKYEFRGAPLKILLKKHK